jgi:tetratricopeptide (TPR) repeat protein
LIQTRTLFFLLLLLPVAGKALINRDSLQVVLDQLEPDSAMLENYLAVAADMGGDEIAAAKQICNWVYEESQAKNLYAVQAHALYGIGRAYLITDDFDPATVYFNRALTLAQQYDLKKTEVSCYIGFGNIYSASHQYAEARRNYTQAITISVQTGDTAMAASASFNLASLIMEVNADSNALRDCIRYLDLALSLVTEQRNPDVYINAMGLKAFVYSNAGRFDSVPYFLGEAQRVIEAGNYDEYRPQIDYYRGLHFLNLKQYDPAIAHFENGLTLSRRMNSLWWAYNFYDGLSRAYAANGNYETALFFYKRHKAAYDSLINEENFNKVLDLRHLYENEKQEKEMLETRRAKMMSDEQLETEIRRKNNLILLVAGVSMALLVFAFLIVRLRSNIRERKLAYEQLEEKNIEIQQQSGQLVRQSKEIARYQSQMNPHFVFNALNSIQGHVMSDDKDKTISQLQYFSRLMRQTLNNSDCELISLQTEFEFLRLYFSFEKGRFEKQIDLQLLSDVDEENTLIPPMLIQPFIENALKHAGLDQVTAPVIRLHVNAQDTLLKIVITDNGMGMRSAPGFRAAHPHAADIVQSRIQLLFETQVVPMPARVFAIGPATDFPSGTQVQFFLPLINRF